MALDEKQAFPQIPATVWWGLREMFYNKLPSTVTDSYLASSLNVQPVAAKAYIGELKKLGLLDEDSKPTDVASKWRMPSSYREAADELLQQAYPQELLDVAPPHEEDREKVVRWFMTAGGLGQGSAKNKAATYLMIGAADLPDETPKPRASASSASTPKVKKSENSKTKDVVPPKGDGKQPAVDSGLMPLNVNVQIHISADASNDQIESIFSNMKKYLR